MTSDESDCIEANYGAKKEDGWISFFQWHNNSKLYNHYLFTRPWLGNGQGRSSVSFHKYSKTGPMMAKEWCYYRSIIVSRCSSFFLLVSEETSVSAQTNGYRLSRKNSSSKTEVPEGWPFTVCIPCEKQIFQTFLWQHPHFNSCIQYLQNKKGYCFDSSDW